MDSEIFCRKEGKSFPASEFDIPEGSELPMHRVQEQADWHWTNGKFVFHNDGPIVVPHDGPIVVPLFSPESRQRQGIGEDVEMTEAAN
jgi:hypothetical protein